MFERFTDTARHIVVQAQADARRLGYNYIGCEHLLLATATTGEPASAVLRDHGVTPERIEAEILRTIGRGQTADLLGGLDREALASQPCATRASRPNASRRKYCAPWGEARRPARWAASTEKRWLPSASTSTPSVPGSRRRSARTPSPQPSRPPAGADGQPGGRGR